MSNKSLIESISFKVEETKPCQKKFNFTIDQDTVKREAGKTTREFAGMVVIPGFRKGKAPVSMIMSRYGEEVKSELKKRFYSAAFQKVTEDKSLDIVSYGAPSEDGELKLDAEYRFALTFDVAPEFNLPEYKGIKVEVPAAEVSDEEVEKRVEYYKGMYAAYEDISSPAQKDDMLKVSYTSDFAVAADAPAGLARQVQANDNWLWLSEPEMIPGAINALMGAEAGKEYNFTAEYPADYREAALAGKKIAYKLTVNTVQRRKALEEAELCEKMKVESPEKLRETLKNNIIRESEMKRNTEVANLAYEKLSNEIGHFEISPALLEGEIERELKRVVQANVKKEEDVEEFKKNIEAHKKEAAVNAALRLRRVFILRKIAEKENIKVESHEFDGELKNMSKYYGYKEKELRSMLEKSGGIEEMHLDILSGKVSDFLAKNAQIVDVPARKK
ncbi:MAG: trigger factor [Victivallaceae bacterium]